MPQLVPDAIGTTIKSEEHFWHFWDELLSCVHQLPDEDIHALFTHITSLIAQCKFPHGQTQEMLQFMLLQHAV